MDSAKTPTQDIVHHNELGDVRSFYFVPIGDNFTGDLHDFELYEQLFAFKNDLESYYKARKIPSMLTKFYQESLDCYNLWMIVLSLGGYEKVTEFNLWYKVGQLLNLKNLRTCMDPSDTFRSIYEKTLKEYEMHKVCTAELELPSSAQAHSISVKKTHEQPIPNFKMATRQVVTAMSAREVLKRSMQITNTSYEGNSKRSLSTLASGRAEREAAGRARKKWRTSLELSSDDENLEGSQIKNKIIDLQGVAESESLNHRMVIYDVGPQTCWVKISALETDNCYEIYFLIHQLRHEELQIQTDPGGRLIITHKPNNLLSKTSFKKVIILPKLINPLKTRSTVLSDGRVTIRLPFIN